MANETISEQCETLYNKLNTFVESEISRDVTPQISNLNSRIDALEPNLVRVKEVNGNVSSVSAGGTSTKTFTVPACPSGYNWEYLSTSTGWGTVSSASLSGTTLTVTLLNVSNTSHDISFRGVLMYYPKTIEAEPHITVSATNPYLLSGEVTDLVVYLVDEFGLPLSNKTVTISDGTSSYNGITNNQGTFTLYDVEVSSGYKTFTATYGTVSDSVDVFLCTSVDYGTINKHTDIWQSTNATISREDTYSLLTETTATGFCMLNSSNKIAPSKTVELDLCQVDGGNTYAPLYIRNDGGGTSLGRITYDILGATVGEWIHLKIVFSDSNTATVYSSTLNEPLALTLSNTSTNYRIMFNATGTITKIQFKNVAIY